jgi:hypothetical protein
MPPSFYLLMVAGAAVLALAIYFGCKYDYPVSASESDPCRMVYVKTTSSAFVDLYEDDTMSIAEANPFIVRGNQWEIHTTNQRNLVITEVPCRQ